MSRHLTSTERNAVLSMLRRTRLTYEAIALELGCSANQVKYTADAFGISGIIRRIAANQASPSAPPSSVKNAVSESTRLAVIDRRLETGENSHEIARNLGIGQSTVLRVLSEANLNRLSEVVRYLCRRTGKRPRTLAKAL